MSKKYKVIELQESWTLGVIIVSQSLFDKINNCITCEMSSNHEDMVCCDVASVQDVIDFECVENEESIEFKNCLISALKESGKVDSVIFKTN